MFLLRAFACLALLGSSALAQVAPMPPGGRIGISPGVFNMQSDYVGASTVYYGPTAMPPLVSIFNGAGFVAMQFTSSLSDNVGVALTLDPSWPANTVFDQYLYSPDGVHVAACAIPWTLVPGTTTQQRSVARVQYGGQLVNGVAATCRASGSVTVALPQYQGSYVGKFLTSATTPGVIDFKFGNAATGGGAARIAVSNAYNSIPLKSVVQDNNVNWAPVTTHWEPLDQACTGCSNGQQNFIIFVSEGTSIDASLSMGIYPAGGENLYVGIALNGSFPLGPVPGIWSKCAAAPGGPAGATSIFHSVVSLCAGSVPEGLNVLQAAEMGTTAGAGSFYSNQNPQLGALIMRGEW